MGLDAQVIAIGTFSRSIVSALEYPPEFYSNVNEGDIIVVNVFIAPTSDISHRLAQAFSVGAFDLGQHHLKPEVADLELLADLFGAEDTEQFVALRQAQFHFYYLPNG